MSDAKPKAPALAVVTGAAGGVGSAVAARLLDRGLRVLLVSRSYGFWSPLGERHAKLPWVGPSGEGYGPLNAHAAMARDWAGGAPAALVHCAATLGPAGVSVRDADFSGVAEAVRDNLAGTLAALKFWLSLAGPSRAVLFSGGGSCYGRPGFAAYAAGKCGVLRLAECVAAEERAAGLSVVCAAPGPVDTPMLAACRQAGDHVDEGRVTPMADVCDFVERLLFCPAGESMALSGRLVHVRDEWAGKALTEDQWKLRRTT